MPSTRKTGRHTAERALRESEARYRYLVDHASDIIYSCDANGCFTSVSRTGRVLLQYDESALIGRHFLRVVRKDFRDRTAAHYAQQWLDRTPNTYFEFPAVARDGTVVWFGQNVQLVVEGDRIVGIQAIARDITKQKQVEEALRQSEGRYRSLIHEAAYGIYRSSRDGRLLDVNPALVSMLGYGSVDELAALNLRDIYRDPPERDRLIARYGQEDVARGVEVDWKRKDGTPIRVRLSVRVVGPASGSEGAFEGIVEDVTERRALEERLRQSQQMEAVGRLARGIAHDFNNVLAAIAGSCDLLMARLASGDPSQPEVEEIQRAAERGAALTRRLLAFSRHEPVARERLDLRLVVQDMAGMLRRLAGEPVKMHVDTGNEALIVLAEPSQIEQVLLNLVVNARDAMPDGGTLGLAVDADGIDRAESARRGWPEGRYARLTIRDTGMGIAPELQAQIFEPFFTTKDPDRGGGLGLSIVYSIVRDCGGLIRTASEPGRGTTFEVLLPLA